MQGKIEQAMREALAARERADACIDTETRERWLEAAAMWDRLVHEFTMLQKEQEASYG